MWPAGKAWIKSALLDRTLVIDKKLAGILEERRLSSPEVRLASGERSYVAVLRRLPQSPWFLLELDQAFAWAQRIGFTLLYPYFDRDLMQLLLRFHPEHLLVGGKSKGPLRRMVSERLPIVKMPSRKVDFSQMVHNELRPHALEQWNKMNGRKFIAELGISTVDKLETLLERYSNGQSNDASLIWRILSAEAWLRRQPDRGKFQRVHG
jgi:hypothetical protein